jgi:hypothetical protein
MRYKRRRTTLNASHESTSFSYGSGHLVPWLWPWVVALALLPLSGLLWLLWGNPPSTWGGAAITLLTHRRRCVACRAGADRSSRGWRSSPSLCGGWLPAVSTGLSLARRPWWPNGAADRPVGGTDLRYRYRLDDLRGLRSRGEHDNGWSRSPLASPRRLPGATSWVRWCDDRRHGGAGYAIGDIQKAVRLSRPCSTGRSSRCRRRFLTRVAGGHVWIW